MDTDEKVVLLKKLFYSNYTEKELKQKLNVNSVQYRRLLDETKKQLGLPYNYRRQPHRYGKYHEDSYYILHHKIKEDDYEILSYNPSLNYLKYELTNMSTNDNDDYRIEKASDDNLKKLIYHLYYEMENNWESIMCKLELPYHKFYGLLNDLKKENKSMNGKTNRMDRFIYKYKPTKKYMIVKYVNGKRVNFGYYDTKESARQVRDYLETINWDINLFKKNKDKIFKV